MATGQLTEGQHLDFTFQMTPGKCYTIIGFGAGIKNLDLNLLAPPFYNVLAGQDTTDNNTPVVGGVAEPDVSDHPAGDDLQGRHRRAQRQRQCGRADLLEGEVSS